MMGLDKEDGHASMALHWGLHMPLPPASNPAELEERRRTFWLLYIFDAFAGVRTNSSSTFDKLVGTTCFVFMSRSNR